MNSSGGCSNSSRVQGLLADTDVIITSDHGEAFGEHGMVGHSHGVAMEELGVARG